MTTLMQINGIGVCKGQIFTMPNMFDYCHDSTEIFKKYNLQSNSN